MRPGVFAAREAVRGRERLGQRASWSIGDSFGNNLLNPGDTPHANMQFLFFCLAVIRAVDTWQGLLRMSIASAGNDIVARERSPAGDSVGLPRRYAHRHLRADRIGPSTLDQNGRRSRHRRVGVAQAAARRRGSQPDVAVRIHRQQVRVPRRFLESEHHGLHVPQRCGGRITGLHGRPARTRSPKARASKTPSSTCSRR